MTNTCLVKVIIKITLIRNIERFNPKDNEITSYLERLQQLLRTQIFVININGMRSLWCLKPILTQDLPSQKPYIQNVEDLKKHCSRKQLVIVERCRFHITSRLAERH